MKTTQPGKGKRYFQDLPKIDFGKLMAEVKEKGYLFYKPAKKQSKDKSKN